MLFTRLPCLFSALRPDFRCCSHRVPRLCFLLPPLCFPSFCLSLFKQCLHFPPSVDLYLGAFGFDCAREIPSELSHPRAHWKRSRFLFGCSGCYSCVEQCYHKHSFKLSFEGRHGTHHFHPTPPNYDSPKASHWQL